MPNSELQNCYNAGEIQATAGTKTWIGGNDGYLAENTTASNVYSIGKLSENAAHISGSTAYYAGGNDHWTNWFWLENMGATFWNYDSTSSVGKASSTEIKALVSNRTFDNTIWATNSSINNGYPYLKIFGNTNIWLRDSAINDGDPYLKDNPPVE